MPEPVVIPEQVPSDLDNLMKEFMKIPDFIRYPLPEWMYKKYNIKKPSVAEISEVVTYTTPPHLSLNTDGKVEVLPIAEGGVREVPTGVVAPSEVTVIPDTIAIPDTIQTHAAYSNVIDYLHMNHGAE